MTEFTLADFAKPDDIYIKEYSGIKLKVLSELNDYMTSLEDIEEIIGAGNIDLMIDNHKNHVEFMETFFEKFDTGVLPEIMTWFFKAYMSRGMSVRYREVQLDAWLNILKNNMSADGFNAVSPVYIWLQENLAAAEKTASQQ